MIQFVVFIAILNAIPYEDQRALTNSLIVGKDNDLQKWNCKTCSEQNRPIFASFIENPTQDIKCILSAYPKFIILAFRYTATIKNVWQDLLYANQILDQNTCDNCKVQKQYNKMWNTIRQNVIDSLKHIHESTNVKKLVISGISLGGGLAGLAYIDIQNENVTTFGAPRVGNKKWAAWFDQKTSSASKRYAIYTDPIPHLPRCITPLCNYRQTGIKYVCKINKQACSLKTSYKQDLQQLQAMSEKVRQVGASGLIAHIMDYPKIYNYTLQ